MMDKEKVLNSFAMYKLLVEIYVKTKKNEEFSLSDLARGIQTSPSNPSFQKICSVLISEKSLTVVKKYGKSKIFILDLPVLERIIRSTNSFEVTSEFIKSSTIGYYF